MGVLAGFLFLLPGCHGAFVFVGVYLLLLFDIPPKGFEVNIYIYYTYTYPSIWSPPIHVPTPVFSISAWGRHGFFGCPCSHAFLRVPVDRMFLPYL